MEHYKLDGLGWTCFSLSILFAIAVCIYGIYIVPKFIEFSHHSQSEWVHIRRHKATMFTAVIVGSQPFISAILQVLNMNFQIGSPFLYQFWDYLFITIATVPYFYRFHFGWYRIKLNEALCEWSWKRAINPMDTHFVMKFERVLNNRWIVLISITMGQFLNSLISYYIAIVLQSEWGFSHHYFVYIWLMLTLVFQSPIIIVWMYTITKQEDAYKLRSETVRTIFICQPWQLISKSIAVFLVLYGYLREAAFIASMGNGIACMTCVYYIIAYPLSELADKNLDQLPLTVRASSNMHSLSNNHSSQSPRPDGVSRQRSRSTIESRLLLTDILGDETLFRGFAEHLVKEFSIENIVFLVEVMQWKTTVLEIYKRIPNELIQSKPDIEIPSSEGDKYLNNYGDANILEVGWLPIHPIFDKKRLSIVSIKDKQWLLSVAKKAAYVFNKYIVISAALSVNISYEDRRQCTQTYEKMSDCVAKQSFVDSPDAFLSEMNDLNIYSMFDRAFRSVIRVLKGDSLVRFRQSDSFQQWIDKNRV